MLTFDPAKDPEIIHFGVLMGSIWPPYGAQVSLGSIKKTPENTELNFGALFRPKMEPQNGGENCKFLAKTGHGRYGQFESPVPWRRLASLLGFFAPNMAQEPLFDPNLRQMWALH